jgi:hypothetical protein
MYDYCLSVLLVGYHYIWVLCYLFGVVVDGMSLFPASFRYVGAALLFSFILYGSVNCFSRLSNHCFEHFVSFVSFLFSLTFIFGSYLLFLVVCGCFSQ